MAINQAPMTDIEAEAMYGELLAEGSFADEPVHGPLASWPDELLWKMLNIHTDPDLAQWDEIAVRRLSYERFHRAWDPKADTTGAEPDHLVFCRFIARARTEGKFVPADTQKQLDNRGEV